MTLEVDTVDAQKVWLASSVGNLSLLLRKAGETAQAKTRKITLNDLGGNEQVDDDKGDHHGGGDARRRRSRNTPCRSRAVGPLAAAERGNAAR